mgnify:FL=1
MANVKMQHNTDRSKSFLSFSDEEAMEKTSLLLATSDQRERWKYTKGSDILELFLSASVKQENTVIKNAECASIHVGDSGLEIEKIRKQEIK